MTSSFKRKAGAAGVAALIVGGAIAITAPAVASPSRANPRALEAPQIAQIRQEVRRYADVKVALDEGFVQAGPCAASPDGGMGIHFIKPDRMAGPIDAAKPQILLYGPTKDGDLALLGVEYWRADADQDLATDPDRPSLFGVAFDGPMPGHDAAMPVHYDLHVWLNTPNPSGLFAPWNPKVSCDPKAWN